VQQRTHVSRHGSKESSRPNKANRVSRAALDANAHQKWKWNRVVAALSLRFVHELNVIRNQSRTIEQLVATHPEGAPPCIAFLWQLCIQRFRVLN
jgi:hypothetical protein